MAIREAATPIRVVLIDDNADFLRLIRVRLELEHDIVVIGEAEEGETGVALAFESNPILSPPPPPPRGPRKTCP